MEGADKLHAANGKHQLPRSPSSVLQQLALEEADALEDLRLSDQGNEEPGRPAGEERGEAGRSSGCSKPNPAASEAEPAPSLPAPPRSLRRPQPAYAHGPGDRGAPAHGFGAPDWRPQQPVSPMYYMPQYEAYGPEAPLGSPGAPRSAAMRMPCAYQRSCRGGRTRSRAGSRCRGSRGAVGRPQSSRFLVAALARRALGSLGALACVAAPVGAGGTCRRGRAVCHPAGWAGAWGGSAPPPAPEGYLRAPDSRRAPSWRARTQAWSRTRTHGTTTRRSRCTPARSWGRRWPARRARRSPAACRPARRAAPTTTACSRCRSCPVRGRARPLRGRGALFFIFATISLSAARPNEHALAQRTATPLCRARGRAARHGRPADGDGPQRAIAGRHGAAVRRPALLAHGRAAAAARRRAALAGRHAARPRAPRQRRPRQGAPRTRRAPLGGQRPEPARSQDLKTYRCRLPTRPARAGMRRGGPATRPAQAHGPAGKGAARSGPARAQALRRRVHAQARAARRPVAGDAARVLMARPGARSSGSTWRRRTAASPRRARRS